MKVHNIFTLPRILKRELGHDLVISIIMDGDKTRLSISTYKSKWNLVSGADIQTCEISRDDMKKPIKQFAKELVELYRTVLTTEEVERLNEIE